MSLLWQATIALGMAGLAMLAWSLRALDVWGAAASFLLGVWVALAADLQWFLVLLSFTLIGTGVTRLGLRRKLARKVAEDRKGERGARNVVANGGAPALAVLAALWWPEAGALAFVTAVAVVTADTMASEIGSMSRTARTILPPFGGTPPGRNGSVSWPGQNAAALGAVVIALIAAGLGVIPALHAWVPALGGFLGCQIDSVLGALWEADEERPGRLSNSDVNFLASVIPAALVLLMAA